MAPCELASEALEAQHGAGDAARGARGRDGGCAGRTVGAARRRRTRRAPHLHPSSGVQPDCPSVQANTSAKEGLHMVPESTPSMLEVQDGISNSLHYTDAI